MAERIEIYGRMQCMMIKADGTDDSVTVPSYNKLSKPHCEGFFDWCRGQQIGSSKVPLYHGCYSRTQKIYHRRRLINNLQSQLYLHMTKASSSFVGYGAVFNLEFSPTGKILVAACEGNAMKFYDPLALCQIQVVPKAHTDCVNCISYSSEATKPTELVCLDRLMRTRLTPDDSKMILSTSLGYYLIIHDLDLLTLAKDLKDFSSDDYYLLLQEKDPKDLTNHPSNHVFHQKRNRVELVMDFPRESYPWCISSLVVHPQSWCMMSRFTSEMEDSEWTCVHDIQGGHCNLDKDIHDSAAENSTPFHPQDRLLYYMSEPNDGRGYIKELSVSPDGRYICSSFGYGVRLLTFNTDCSELCDLNPTGGNSKELTEKCLLISHKRTVVTSEFSPTHPTLVTGCLEGELVFHQARL
ncbi:putative DDB1- and CUL4-associated factor 10-like [Apostichopus japonicus]|uniref:Putative DDB1-and CUL4-associated factor 10-like n=1 Tax=Stichopus japonicus TaxID=307972 RepID=A0A2G8LGJ3_STIJA|nr:putative DDB1- and CUL4-associated factor 10-like [Apostichopus japonicus]